jgi:protein SDA1
LAIANNFITERNSSEVIAVGINAVREICAKCPLAMSEDLLGDLVQYRSYKDRAVTTAAKSLISLFRERNPHMLQRKLRGRPTEASVEKGFKQKIYGETDIKSYIPGAEVIELEEKQSKKDKSNY